MKKFRLTSFIVVVYCASIVFGCRPTKQRPSVDTNNETSDRQKRRLALQISTDTSTTTDASTPDSNVAELASTTVTDEISVNLTKDQTFNYNTTNVLEKSEFSKNKSSEGDTLLPSSNEQEVDEIKSRKTRQKSYKCYCEEASYRSDCLKKCQNDKQFDNDDYSLDASTEVTDNPLETYSTKVPRITSDSDKFRIPYAKNLNFNQRVILGNKYPPSYTFYPANPQIKIPKNHLFPVYPQTPHLQYAISYPKIGRPGIPTMKQNYLTSVLKNPVSKGTYAPSIIGRNFANIQECIQLHGQTVCVIAPTTKSAATYSETTTTDNFMTGNSMEKNINEIDHSCTDNNPNQNMKTIEYPTQLIYQTNTDSPPYEIKYPSIHNSKLKSTVKIDKLYSVGTNPPKLSTYVGNNQEPYTDHFNYDRKIFLNNGQINNLQKSFNGQYYLNKNDLNVVQAASPNNNDKEKQLQYYQSIGITTPKPITQKPVYATKYPLPTTPSYIYLDEYHKSRNDYSKEIINSKENSEHSNIGQNYLEDANVQYQTVYPPYVQQSNQNTGDHSINKNNYLENRGETTGYPVHYPTTVPISRYDYIPDPKFVTSQPMQHYNGYKNDQVHNLLSGIQSIINNKYVGSQEKGSTNYPNILEQTTIPPFLQRTSTSVVDQQKSDYQSLYEENVSSNLRKNYQKINENNYNLGKTNNNYAKSMSPNAEKDKTFFSNEYNYNSDVKEISSERTSHTSNYISNSISENQSIEQATEGIKIENNLHNSNERDSSEIITSIRKEYDSDDYSKPISFSHDPQRSHQTNYENINSYKSDSVQDKNNKLHYSANEAFEYEKYKNNERPQPQFDYSNFPQSMSRIINDAKEQYITSQHPQYHPGIIVQEYPNDRVYDSNDKNMHSYNNEDSYTNQYNIYTPTPATPNHNYRINGGFNTDSPRVNSNSFSVINSPDPPSYVDQNIPVYTTISMQHTTPPTMSYNNKEGTTINKGFYYPTTDSSNYEYEDRYNTRFPLKISNLEKQDVIGQPGQFQNAQIPNVKVNSKFLSNTFTSKTNSDLVQDTAKSITTLKNLEEDEYKEHYNPIRTSTVRSADNPNINDPNIQSRMKYPTRLDKKKMRLQMFNDTENLFKGLEQIILNNYDPVLSEESLAESIEKLAPKESTRTGSKNIAEKILFGKLNQQIKENVQKYGKTGISEIEYNMSNVKASTGTENPIQSVDDIPATVRENVNSELTTQATVNNNETPQQSINEFLVENTIKEVLNNFVPGRTEDLVAKYENKNEKEMVRAEVSNLHPEIVGTYVLRNLLSIPEVENMIINAAGGLLGRVTHIALSDLSNRIRKSFRHVVNNEIRRPPPTLAPFTVEEHRFQDGEWVTEQVSLLGNSKTAEKSLPREIFDKIRSILNRSRMSEEEAAQPIVQNLIVKAVKYSLDKERGIVQESAIRQAFKIIVKPIRDSPTSAPSYSKDPTVEVKKANVPESVETPSFGSYKFAPVVPITESNYHNGYWRESQKLLVDTKRKKISTSFDENAKQAMQKQLNKVKKIKVTSKEEENPYIDISDINSETSSEYEFGYEDANEYGDEGEYSVIEGNAKENVTLTNTYDEDRQPIKYYSPTDRVLEYLKMHQNALNPSFSTTAEIIGRKNEVDTTTPMSNTQGGHSPLNNESEVTENSVLQNTYPEEPHRNKLNLLFESPKHSLKPKGQTVTNDGKNFGQNNQFFGDPLTEYSPQLASNLQTYMGRLVPVDEKASQAKDLNDLQNSNLVYVGDGVRLPLTIRKLSDGTFALTLSDELCKQFLQKQCPCCLPDTNGFIVREQKSIKDDATWNISNDELERTTKKMNSNPKSQYNHRRHYENKDPTEVTTPAEDFVAHISPRFYNEEEFEEQINVAPSEEELNSNSDIYSRNWRESEEQREVIQEEIFPDRENIMENNIGTSIEEKGKVSIVNDGNNERGSQKFGDSKGYQIDNNERESIETQFDYQEEDPLEHGLHVIPRMIGPYRYQQLYANENADALRNMLYMMQAIDSGEE